MKVAVGIAAAVAADEPQVTTVVAFFVTGSCTPRTESYPRSQAGQRSNASILYTRGRRTGGGVGETDQPSSQLEPEPSPGGFGPRARRRSGAPSTPPVISVDSCDERGDSCTSPFDGSPQPLVVESIAKINSRPMAFDEAAIAVPWKSSLKSLIEILPRAKAVRSTQTTRNSDTLAANPNPTPTSPQPRRSSEGPNDVRCACRASESSNEFSNATRFFLRFFGPGVKILVSVLRNFQPEISSKPYHEPPPQPPPPPPALCASRRKCVPEWHALSRTGASQGSNATLHRPPGQAAKSERAVRHRQAGLRTAVATATGAAAMAAAAAALSRRSRV